MQESFKFPNGYEVTVCRKGDIVDCLDKNIIDKEVVLAVISQCELDASDFIRAGRWTGLPFIGSLRVPPLKKRFFDEKTQRIIKEASDELDSERFYIFRHEVGVDAATRVAENRFFRYILSGFVVRNRKYYNKLVKTKGENYANFLCYTLANLTTVTPAIIETYEYKFTYRQVNNN